MSHQLSRTMVIVAVGIISHGGWVRGSESALGSPPAEIDAPPVLPATAVLQIHLPREVIVQGNLLTLGQISVVKGEGSLAAAAGKIGLGQFSVPGQKAILDRATILSRLASHGIAAGQVRLTGAETVTVRRHQKTIEGDEFVEMSRQFLRQHPPGPSIAEMVPVTRPKDLILEGQVRDLQVTPRFVRTAARGYVAVQITVTGDGKELGVREVPFRLKYQCRRVATVKEIAEGAALTPNNVKIETVVSDQPEPANWRPPYGLVAVRTLPAGTEVRSDMIGLLQSPVVVRRNETVVIRAERPGLLITAVGTALQEARAGEYVKVRNADSSRIIICKVNGDGTVEPML
jgi:flagella basal body P-ring formation protein FlgA